MMQARIEQAAQYLVNARSDKILRDRIPEEYRPQNSDEALAVQRRIIKLRGEKIGGWKCSVPIGDKLLLAPLPASTIFRTSPCSITPKGSVAEVEPEIAFVLGTSLKPRSAPYTEDEVRSAIRETRLVLELMGSRYKDPSAVSWFEALADSVRHQGMFIGPILSNAFDKPIESFHLKVESPAGSVIDRDVSHPNGHPFRPLHWLANFLSARGEGLEDGQIVTTGSYAGIIEVPMSAPVTFSYGNLGAFTVEFCHG